MLATVLHLGLMNVQFDSRSFLVPSVSLPHSVSIMLTKKSRMATSKQAVAEDIGSKKDTVPVEEKTILPAVKKIPVESKAEVKSVQPAPIVMKKAILRPTAPVEISKEEPVVASPVPAQEIMKDRPVEVQHVENISTETSEKTAVPTETQTGDDENMAAHSGVLQKAYPRYQLNDPPVYPNLARKRGQQGTVVLQVLVNGQGRVDDIRLDVSTGYSMLDRAAVTAVKNWLFEPGRQGETTVPMWVRIPVTFELKKK